MGINSTIGDVPSSTVIGAPKRVYARTDDEEKVSLFFPMKRLLYDVTFLHSLAGVRSIVISVGDSRKKRGSRWTPMYNTYIHVYYRGKTERVIVRGLTNRQVKLPSSLLVFSENRHGFYSSFIYPDIE